MIAGIVSTFSLALSAKLTKLLSLSGAAAQSQSDASMSFPPGGGGVGGAGPSRPQTCVHAGGRSRRPRFDDAVGVGRAADDDDCTAGGAVATRRRHHPSSDEVLPDPSGRACWELKRTAGGASTDSTESGGVEARFAEDRVVVAKLFALAENVSRSDESAASR